MDDQQKIKDLLVKLEQLLKRQDQFQLEINQLRTEIFRLQDSLGQESIKERLQIDPLLEETAAPENILAPSTSLEQEKGVNPPPRRRRQAPKEFRNTTASKPSTPGIFEKLSSTVDFEKFIGENLFSKIGILITFIGVVIGARFAIENNMVSPLTRVIMGYLVGFGLLLTALKLKAKYLGFSAVLLSGAMAILYFITFAAFSFYGLIPQMLAFGLMLLFTIFTVVAALNYDKEIIAIIGLVGAYGVPFLVSSGSGNMFALFAYMALINIGVLVISFRKSWKPLYYSAFVFTWLIFGSWALINSKVEDFNLGMSFAFVFFLLFYLTFLAYKLIRQEELDKTDSSLILLNSFLFFGLGYFFCEMHSTWAKYLGLFTLLNALLHFVVSAVLFQRGLARKNIFYLISGLVLVFLTIAIPVQLDGNWVTLLWIGEAALLFWIGRTKKVEIYEQLSLGLMALAVSSLFQDWTMAYGQYPYQEASEFFTPFLNIHFLSSLLFIGGLSAIYYLHQRYESQIKIDLIRQIPSLIPIALILVAYFSIFFEIGEYWGQAYMLSRKQVMLGEVQRFSMDDDLLNFRSIWWCNYSMLFCSLLIFVYLKWFKKHEVDWIVAGVTSLSLLAFLGIGLYAISELRDSYLNAHLEDYFLRSSYHIYIRYISLVFCGILVFALSKIIRPLNQKIFDLFLAGTILWITSSELINLRALIIGENNYKIGLSILWGVYALLLVGLGIWKKKRHLRVAAIVLFALTLAKLFLYDLVHLDTIAKTIVLVSLGILLLIISFLYNKYQIGEDETN